MPQQIPPEAIKSAYERIAGYINKTPLLESSILNSWLGSRILFKFEGFQKTGAFKARGALNALLSMKEQGRLPESVIAFSSGNHAQAVALACGMVGVKCKIVLPKIASKIKIQATKSYGAEVVITETRQEAEAYCAEAEKNGAYFLHPFDNDMIIAGQGTACYEALAELKDRDIAPNAIFATCGGGGWMSGTYLAAKLLSPGSKTYAVEPLLGNDAAQSYKSGEIFRFNESPKTIADGARSHAVSERTFSYLRQIDGFYEASEEQIIYWTQWLAHLLKVSVEPTSAVAMAGAFEWLKSQQKNQVALVMLSGGNIDPESHRAIWQQNYLESVPLL